MFGQLVMVMPHEEVEVFQLVINMNRGYEEIEQILGRGAIFRILEIYKHHVLHLSLGVNFEKQIVHPAIPVIEDIKLVRVNLNKLFKVQCYLGESLSLKKI